MKKPFGFTPFKKISKTLTGYDPIYWPGEWGTATVRKTLSKLKRRAEEAKVHPKDRDGK